MSRKISSAIFGIALICFLLPWVNVSCQGQKVASFTGIQLVTGTTIEEPQIFGPAKKRKINGETFAILAFLAVIAGCIFSFSKGKIGSAAPVVAGGIGVVLLFLLKSKIDGDVMKQTGGMLLVNYAIGFYLTLILSLSGLGVNAYSVLQSKRLSLPRREVRGIASNFCSQCGSKVELGAAFCSECGHSLK